MTGVNSGGGAGTCGVFLTNFNEIGSLDHSCMQIHTTINVRTTNEQNKRKTNKKKGKITKPSLRYLDLDDS